MKKLIFYILFFASSLSFAPKCFAFEKEMAFLTYPHPFSQERIPQYLESIDESTTLNEVIDFLFDLRKMLVSEGYSVPFFSEIFVTFFEQIKTQPNISLDGEFILNFYQTIITKEENLYSPTSLKPLKYLEQTKTLVFFAKETKETGIKISSGFAIRIPFSTSRHLAFPDIENVESSFFIVFENNIKSKNFLFCA